MRSSSTVYRGKSGQWAFILHRITGFLVFAFIVLHIVDVATLSSPSTYDAIHRLYGNVFLRSFEVGLLFALLYHALNGLRVVMIDFFPGVIRNEKGIFIFMLSLSVVATLLGAVVILRPFFQGVPH